MDKLSHLISQEAGNDNWKPIQIGRNGPCVSHLISFVSCVMVLIIYVRCLGNWLALIKRPSCLLKVLLQVLEETLLVKQVLERFTLLASFGIPFIECAPKISDYAFVVDMWKPRFLIGRPTNFPLLVG